MKQGTIKSLGVAALGAVVATGAAGTASAAGPVEQVATTTASLTRQLPIEEVSTVVPGGPVLTATNRTIGSSAFKSAAQALDKALVNKKTHKTVKTQPTEAAPAPAKAAPAGQAAPAAPRAAAVPADAKGNGGLLGALNVAKSLPIALPTNGISTPGPGGH